MRFEASGSLRLACRRMRARECPIGSEACDPGVALKIPARMGPSGRQSRALNA
jgi:hypothetical protein